ncbi:MAG: nucleotide exchange factor GrpE [Sedimentisphaerales bacterium]|nr:nucleotide exchange factor GrpE [Sedimentisphaerales bacterium]
MSKLWIIWALLLVVIGMAGLGYVVTDKYRETLTLTPYQDRFNESQDEYLVSYEQWSQLSEEEKEENPWGQGKYGGEKTKEQLTREQPARLKANLVDLARGIKEPHPLADMLYGFQWRKEVADYRKKLEIRDHVAVGGTICLAAGLLLMFGYLSRVIVGRITHRDSSAGTKYNQESDKAIQNAKRQERQNTTVREGPESFVERASRECSSSGPLRNTQTRDKQIGYFEAARLKENTESRTPPAPKKASRIPAVSTEEMAGQFEPGAGFDDITTLMSTEPVGEGEVDHLTELTQEMSAIRQFAVQQQDRVRQLQEGYDWNIIKRFCMRVIRCIDNLETRIEKSREEGADTECFEDVRDELVFALESSGVEQFEPELGGDYKGNEKWVEAIRTRIKTRDATLKGKIAQIVRPGYKYIVSDDEHRVVRCAQVKLYE